ncbi:MAG TPA: hypothetical protein VNP98_15710 [Chthoniobacterales bacterium]|nr:hypothetical protein [Chthoniobacterales bacterium]
MLRVIETRVQDAVTSLVAQVLGVGGQVIFGGHPAITPMVAATASAFEGGERDGERPVMLYQSEYFREAVRPIGRREMESAQLSRTIWVPDNPEDASKAFPLAQEWLQPDRFKQLREGQAHPNADRRLVDALVVFRIVMLLDSRPHAAVSMGGMEGVEAEAMLYQRLFGSDPRRRLFALRSTFGAAGQLGELGIISIDERYFESKDRAPLAESVALLPTAEKQTIGRQLLRRIRYDGIMKEFITSLRNTAFPEQ